MGLNNIFQFWRHLVKSKKSISAQKAVSDFSSVQLIEVKEDSTTAKETKASAQKILGLMFAALHKRGRPAKEKSGVLSYGV